MDQDPEWEEIEEEEAEEMLARVVPRDICLFCAKKSQNIQQNLKHMNLMHGFFIPEEKYLIDLNGLMEYLGFKVGAGTTCLWCEKQFKDLHGVRLHMIYKDHCKIMYDQEKATEYKEFYDYSAQEKIEMKPLNQLAIPKKRPLVRAQYAKKPLSGDKQLMVRTNLGTVAGSYQAKSIKKFDAYRAKILLRTGISNNNTMRGRIRNQNPM